MGDEDDRKAILRRRNRLIALAISGLAGAAPGCYQAHGRGDDAAVAIDAAPPVSCLSAPLEDAGPWPCLEAPLDAGPMPCLREPLDAGPAPCLGAPMEDAGAIPTPCLSMAPDAG